MFMFIQSVIYIVYFLARTLSIMFSEHKPTIKLVFIIETICMVGRPIIWLIYTELVNDPASLKNVTIARYSVSSTDAMMTLLYYIFMFRLKIV